MKTAAVIYDQNQTTSPVETKKLDQISLVESEPIFSIKSVFPFDIFPDNLIVYRKKISIISKNFFFDKDEINIPIENISNVTVHYALFFSSLQITERFFLDRPNVINHLWNKDARNAMQIIDGLRIASKQAIDTLKIPTQELLDKIMRIGSVA